jgi:hypothetical protein
MKFMKHLFSIDLNKRGIYIEWILIISLVFAYFFWLSNNTVYSASANGRLLDVFDGDEYTHFYIVRQALTDRTLCIDFPYYGHFYFNLILFPLMVLQKFRPVSDHVLILALRYVATLSSALTVILTFGLARRYFGRLVAWVSSLFLTILPYIFNYWSVTSHPDTLQMLTIVGGLFGCCEFMLSKKKKWLIVAAVCAGLAFSTKFGGVFLLPIIWLLCLAQFDESRMVFNIDSLRPPRLQSSILLVVVTGVSFLISFIATSPCSFFGGQFIDGILIQSKSNSLGYIFQTSRNHIEWFGILGSSALLGMISSIVLAFALISFVVMVWKTKGKEFLSHKGLLWLWVLFYFTYTFFMVNLREDRHLLVIMPFVFILLTDFLAGVLNYLKRRLPGKFEYYFVVGIIAAVYAMDVYGGFTRQFDLITTRMTREYNNPTIEAGLWLEANYSPSTRILYDKYSYIPPKFDRVHGSWGMDEVILVNFHPKVVLINRSIRDIFLDSNAAQSYTEGKEKFMAIHDFYRLMEEEKLGYVLIKDFGGIQVYEKQQAP